MLATKNPYIESAYEQLQVISQDNEKRWEYEAREKAVRDHNQMMFEAKESKAVEIAKNLLLLGVPIPTIIAGTGLTEEQIEKLKNECNI